MKIAYRLVFVILSLPWFVFSQNQKTVDSLQQQIKLGKEKCPEPCLDDTLIISAYLAWGDEIYLQEPDSALTLWENARALAVELIESSLLDASTLNMVKELLGTSLSNIGYIYDNMGYIGQALKFYEENIVISESIGDKESMAASLNNIGIIYKNRGEIIKALQYYDKSLKIKEEIGDKEGIAYSYNNIGYIYFSQDDIPKALEYLSKGVAIIEEIGDKQGLANSYNNLGYIYNQDGDIEKALDYYTKGLKLREEIQDKQGMANSYLNIGGIHEYNGHIEEALSYYTKSLELREELNDKQGIASSLINIGLIFLQKKHDTKRAKECFDRSYMISKELGFPGNIKDAASGLRMIYEEQGNSTLALKYFKEEILMRDSVQNEENYRATLKQQAKYEFQKQAAIDSIAHSKAIEIKNIELEKSEAEKDKQRVIIWSFLLGSIFILSFAFIILRLFIQKKKANNLLAYQNNEILQQKEEIITQRDEITRHRDVVMTQKEAIEDSIEYANRIQAAVLPAEEQIKQLLGDHFIIFRPHSVVSGDFYWITQVNDWLIVTVADCTGHGVPGAFMSMLGISFLNEIVRKKEITSSAQVLNHLRSSIVESLKQSTKVDSQKDGMDMSFAAINRKTKVCYWAGANNPLCIIRKGADLSAYKDSADMIELIKGDAMPVAVHLRMNEFTNHELELETGDKLYMFSDGFFDQFGGPNGKKYMFRRFRRLLAETSVSGMQEQKTRLEEELEQWMTYEGKYYEQIDDITVLGITI